MPRTSCVPRLVRAFAFVGAPRSLVAADESTVARADGVSRAWDAFDGNSLILSVAFASVVVIVWRMMHPSERRRGPTLPIRQRRTTTFALYREFIAKAHAAILFVGRDGIVHPCNASARAMFDVGRQLPRQRRHVADLFDADDRARVAGACALSLGRPVDDRFGVFVIAATRGRGAPSRWRCRTFDGTPFDADVSFEKVDGDAWPFAIVVRPPSAVTAPAAAAARLNVVAGGRGPPAARPPADVDVVSIVGHELRTPINALVGLAGVLRDRDDESLDPQLRLDLRQIEQTANDMRRMVDALLDLDPTRDLPGPARGGRVAPATLADEVAAELATLAALHRCVIDVIAAHDAAAVAVVTQDAEVIRRVLRNLVSNAIKHAPGATISIDASAGDDGATTFTVADNGPGIDASRIDRLSEPGAAGAAAPGSGGNGLGVAICRQFLRSVGGRLDVRSTAGVGSVFIATIPPRAPSPQPRPS